MLFSSVFSIFCTHKNDCFWQLLSLWRLFFAYKNGSWILKHLFFFRGGEYVSSSIILSKAFSFHKYFTIKIINETKILTKNLEFKLMLPCSRYENIPVVMHKMGNKNNEKKDEKKEMWKHFNDFILLCMNMNFM